VWTAGATTDRLRVDYSFRNDHATLAKVVVIESGTVDTETRAPWIHTTQTTPTVYSLQTIQAVWNDWISQVALPERYKGQPPADTSNKISKSVGAAEGQRELERISRCASGTIADVQGKVSFAALYGQLGSIAAILPLEVYTPGVVSMGYRARLPQYSVFYGWDGAKFFGERKVINSAALTAYGLSRIDNPQAALDDETCKYLPNATLADELGSQVVTALGGGLITSELSSTIAYPELTIGDSVAVETDLLFGNNPITAAAFRGPAWALGRVIGIRDIWGTQLDVWIPGLGNLYGSTTTNIQRQPFEGVRVELEDQSIASQPQNARIMLHAFPLTGATVRYYYHASADTIPEPGSWLWTTYADGAAIDLPRSATATKYLTAYGSAYGQDGPRSTWPIAPGAKATLGTLVGSEASTSLISATAGSPSDNCRSVAYYANATTTSAAPWPTTNGQSTGQVSATFFKRELGVDPSWGGLDASGNSVTGGLIPVAVATGAATGWHAYVIAVPIDANNVPGTYKTLDYPWAGAASPSITGATVTMNATGSAFSTSRTYDVGWTAAAVVTATDSLLIYQTVNGARTLAATATLGVSAATGIAIGYYPSAKPSAPDISVSFDFELQRAAVTLVAGPFTPYPYETFQGAATTV
jgi:hypothetical protein